ncbi:MAG: 50S ribosomal protein L35 [Candidatus Magasanikbacteria bacterium CG10_big_fil_rev_8_21_14_0_10_40_10]|uniref:50S ribosomal protein L35 n=1 Tax=Candidatus Magasanikbacteria bacterium CG10_big_fil_rev_8_21_14_0_10_40_10 TaxID=1974648 RepID=A0A2M6W4X4_9BACT|nr:MAG: 50S ribosomal protein L35 [Candidatus Magasanikbacteria bacterium CG10_big_fil_rev_8_21_14_0_10_40_10]
MKKKTNKAISKRFRQTATGKLMKRAAGQGHFNSRENGKVGRNKKNDIAGSSSNKITKTIKSYL